MAYKALYRKYRPATFSEVYGQDHITCTLKGELSAGKISHAYLFTGTRGTGKTSCARILAKAANCLHPKGGDPCLECEACRAIALEEATDIVELDAASNNGVDDVRILREQIAFTPTTLKYRVYIIDEVHMLTPQAFNALLKTLEEPPKHAIFILATTEVHKLPATILSRCQRFDFRRIDTEKIVDRINFIAEAEGFEITPSAAGLIAAASDGGMRDALSILDLCLSASKSITEDTVTEVCGMSGNVYLNQLSDHIINGDASAALTLIDTLHKNSVDMLRLANDLSAHFRDIMIVKTVAGDKKPIICSDAQLAEYHRKAESFNIKDVMRALNMLSACIAGMQSSNRRSMVEMTIIKLCSPELCDDIDSLEKRIRTLEAGGVKTIIQPAAPVAPAPKQTPAEKPQPAAEEEIPLPEEPRYPDEEIPLPEDITDSSDAAYDEAVPEGDTPCAGWSEILKIIEKSCPPIGGVLSDSRAFISGEYLLIDAPNPMFRNMINSNNSSYRDAIRKAAEQVLGKTYKLGPYRAAAAAQNNDRLAALATKLRKFDIPNS
ncbi:MAG: DNA polymerase III subunit gamma/tau [Clostridia bacterium]|nr:DNA polymerase III subunit gamma/tau [Clostridia bacterium]